MNLSSTRLAETLGLFVIAMTISCGGTGGSDDRKSTVPDGGNSNNKPYNAYIVGSSYGGSYQGGYWKNGAWVGLASQEGSKETWAESLAVSGKDVYVAGMLMRGPSIAGVWKNETWSAFSDLEVSAPSSAHCIAVSGEDVYVAGQGYVASDGINHAGYWKNGIWTGLVVGGSGFPGGYPTAVALSGNDVYISAFARVPANYAGNSTDLTVSGYWKNHEWMELPPMPGGSSSFVYDIKISGADVYASGNSTSGSGITTPGYWKNGTWIGLPAEDPSQDARTYSITLAGQDVYVGGYCDNGIGISNGGYWKNGMWTRLGNGTDSMIDSMAVINGDVIAVGNTTDNWGNGLAGYWKNGTWAGLSDPGDNRSWVALSLVLVED